MTNKKDFAGAQSATEDVSAGPMVLFWQKVEKSDRCWEWQGAITSKGYGNVRIAGKNWLAHRLAYQSVSGSIPRGLVLDHLCRNKRCVRPDHLEVVTVRENNMRGLGPTLARRTHCPRGHEYSGRNLRINSRGDKVCRECVRADSRSRKSHKRIAA